MNYNNEKIKERLKELGFELEQERVKKQTWDRRANMGYLSFVEDEEANENFAGNEELGNSEFVLDLNKDGDVMGIELIHPAPKYIEPETKTFGFDVRTDQDEKAFKKALKTITNIWNRQER